MISLLLNEHNESDISFTLGNEKTESGFIRFRFEFRPTPGNWLVSEWFVPQTNDPDAIRVMARLWETKGTFDSRLKDAKIDVRSYFKDFNARVSLEDHLTYREGRKSLTELSSLDAAYIEWGKSMTQTKEVLSRIKGIEDICVLSLRSPSNPARYFAYRRKMIWESPFNLRPEQWRTMIDSEAGQLGLNSKEISVSALQLNRSISVAVRREVWRRDQGKCVSCDSHERLEFDHVIPVTLGGSNTVRNIQLLCERCNRLKAATLG
jgi:hypothetical protein